MRGIGAVMRLAWEQSSFTDNCFDLFGRCRFCAVRAVRLLRAVAQLFYKFLHYLALHSGCSLMFWLFVFRAVVSFSNVWNGNHLRFASHGETYSLECLS